MRNLNYKVTRSRGFSIVELLTAMVILAVLMLMMTVMLEQVQKSWRFSESRISQFREARVAFDLITKNMSQATSNTYFDYTYDDSTNQVKDISKRSELHFYVDHGKDIGTDLGLSGQVSGHAVFFQAPLGYSVRYRNLGNLFNGRGYLVVHGSDRDFRPSFVKADRYRFRLMEFRPPAEANQVFEDAIDEIEKGGEQTFTKWWNQGLSIGDGAFVDYLNPLAENIVLLLVTPVDSIEAGGSNRYEHGSSEIAPFYTYDSNDEDFLENRSKQVPPMVRVTMVAIDEDTAVRLAEDNGISMPREFSDVRFENSGDYNKDIKRFIEGLNRESRDNRPINYRIFSTTIMMRASKWLG